MAKKKGRRYTPDIEEEKVEKEKRFMSVKDFEDRRVKVPDLGEEDEEDEEPLDDYTMVREDGGEETEEGPCGRGCYEFNTKLDPEHDDECCVHCRFYLTLQCPHLGEFLFGDDD